MSLPNRIPLQSVPFGQPTKDGNLYVEIDWYLFLYNLSVQIFGTGSGGTPASPSDLLDIVDLNSESSDVPQTYRQLANAQVLQSLNAEIDGTDIAGLPLRDANIQALLPDSDVGPDIADLQRKLTNLQALFPDPDAGPTLRDLVNAVVLATQILEQDAPPSAGSWQPYTPTITAGSGAFTTVSGAGRYQRVGNTVYIAIEVDVTAVGTAASNVIASLPVLANTKLPATFQVISGREVSATGKGLTGTVEGNQVVILYYDNSFPGASGTKLLVQGSYETA